MNISGPWSIDQIEDYLESAVIPARVACCSDSGWPASATLWFVYEEGAFWSATPAHAALAGWLERDPRCSIEVAGEMPPYKGVRARARASLVRDPDRDVLRKVIRRYLGSEDSGFARWLLERPVEEMAIRIDPLRITSWDFRARMASAVVEDLPADSKPV